MGEPVHAYGNPLLSAFELDFFDGGQRRHIALGAGWGVRFEDASPVRGFRWNKGDRSFPGWYYAWRPADGRARVVDVRAEDQADERTAETFAATERACSAVGWEFVHVGVPDPVFMARRR